MTSLAPGPRPELVAEGQLRHGDHLAVELQADLYERLPEGFGVRSTRGHLAAGLGALLYVPAHRPNLAEDLLRRRAEGALCVVLDLEDGLPDDAVEAGVANLGHALKSLASGSATNERPLIFVRPRGFAALAEVLGAAGEAGRLLAGAVVPKYQPGRAAAGWFEQARIQSGRSGAPFWLMPILEHEDLAYAERRVDHLLAVREDLEANPSALAVRIGGTDLSGHFGLRRDRDTTVHEIRVVADIIGDVVNVLARGPRPWSVSGPVWEYFEPRERLLRTPLRSSPFVDQNLGGLRESLVRRDLDGLLRESAMDRANGLVGKSVIHPTHVAVVHAVQSVSHEEYADARSILHGPADGARRSPSGDKMNEGRPHAIWARRTIARAKAFGVLRPGRSYVDLLAAGAGQ